MGKLCEHVAFMDIHDLQVCLREVFSTGCFDAFVLYSTIPPKFSLLLSQYQNVVCDDDTTDFLVWNRNMDGAYSAKAGYRWLLVMHVNPIHVVYSWSSF